MPSPIPLLYVVHWKEPSGVKESATTLQTNKGAAAGWLLRLRPHVSPQTVTVEPYRAALTRRR